MAEDNWKNTNVYAGEVKEGDTIKIIFNSLKQLDIKNILPGCTMCTTINGYKDNELSVTFKADKIPYHILAKTQSVVKTIVIVYADGKSEVLRFSVLIVR